MTVTLTEFITAEVKTLMEFSAKYRKYNKDKPEIYPMELNSTFVWFKQYMAYCASKLESYNKNKEITHNKDAA